MNPVAIFTGNLVVYWSSLVIALGIMACFALSLSLYTAHGGKAAAVWALLPLAVFFSVVFCRAIHWYCHMEQYAGFLSAFKDFSVGSYFVQGAIFGVLLAALLVKLMGLTDSTAELLDAAAPGLALCVAFIRLSALFDSTCRSKIIIETPALQHLPLASPMTSASGLVEYRFATFFVEFLIMLVVAVLLLRFYLRSGDRPMKGGAPAGNTARMLLLVFSAVELVLNSTRYDSTFFHFTFLKGLNPYAGFISFAQLIAAVSILCILIHFSKRSVRANSLHPYHWIMWGLWLMGLAAVGVSEYMVQRHGDWYLGCYGVMSLGSILITLIVYRMYKSCLEKE